MKRFGIIGNPLTHSFSKQYFSKKFETEGISECVYENYPLSSIEEFPSLIRSYTDFAGINVTIPYKEMIVPYMDELNETARQIGAVNTIRIKDRKLTGFNTDVYGFTQSLMKVRDTSHTSALILGTGGSSKAVAHGLKSIGIPFLFVSRNPEFANEMSYHELDKSLMKQYKIIVNTTPLGTYPETEICPPISYEYLTDSHLLFDLVYNPSETLFLKKGKEMGAKTKNGQEMLELQAEKSWEIWNSHEK